MFIGVLKFDSLAFLLHNTSRLFWEPDFRSGDCAGFSQMPPADLRTALLFPAFVHTRPQRPWIGRSRCASFGLYNDPPLSPSKPRTLNVECPCAFRDR